MQSGTIRLVLTNGVAAQIFLYRAFGLGLCHQNKAYFCAILGASLFCTYFLGTVKTDLLTSKSNRNEKV